MKSGTVFEGRLDSEAEVRVGEILKVAKPLGIWARKVGIFLVIFSIFGGYWIYGPLWSAERHYRNKMTDVRSQMPDKPKMQTVERSEFQVSNPVSNEYKIFIPKIDASAKVIPNVDPFDKNIYTKALLEGVAEAKGLSHPGQMGTTFLFAHSVGSRVDFARYNAVFYLLDKLVAGDRVYINYHGEGYEYEVMQKEILRANDLKYFENQVSEEKLVLQTCYPPGTSWKRLIVLAKRSY